MKAKSNPIFGSFWVSLQVAASGEQVPLSFRYLLNPAANLNAYKPKKLEDNVSRIGLRAAMFGAIYDKKYQQLPTNEWCKVVWEACILPIKTVDKEKNHGCVLKTHVKSWTPSNGNQTLQLVARLPGDSGRRGAGDGDSRQA